MGPSAVYQLASRKCFFNFWGSNKASFPCNDLFMIKSALLKIETQSRHIKLSRGNSYMTDVDCVFNARDTNRCFRPNRNSAISSKCIWYKSTFLPHCRFLFYKVWWRSDQSICHLLWCEHFPCKFPTQCFAVVVFDGCCVSCRLQAKAYAKQKQRTDT